MGDVSQAEFEAMGRALELARTSGVVKGPNPAVGAVLLDAEGSTVAEGYHRGPGTAHAEAAALAEAGSAARGATAVVTLEPCAHHGRTPPCADALISAGVRRVVFGAADGNPEATGGAARLRAAGIDVVGGVRVEEAQALNPIWTRSVELGRPLVTWKVAASLDGRVAAADGTSKWITCAESRAQVHALRAGVDAVLTGTGTLLADDPSLTARPDWPEPADQPLRVVMGLTPIPTNAAIFDEPDGRARVLATRDPGQALISLGAEGVRHVLLECGPALASAFLREDLVDRVVWFSAPMLLGGSGTPVVDDVGVATLSDARRWRLGSVERVGDDTRTELHRLRDRQLSREAREVGG